MANRMPMILGATAIGGIGFYMYRSGGDSAAAKRAARPSNLSLSPALGDFNIPSSAEKDLKNIGAQAGASLDAAGAKIDTAVAQAQTQLTNTKSTAQNHMADVKHEALKKIDEFDRKVDEHATKAKSWLGGK
ncbi:calcofluor white hypersensitive protein [Ceratocystis lukuohia]|uniref:Calcofluor white hypersensitive protein n=1 Tax=Ceratocystis lukuohia TaxID=2019550 RepID=A0ABR4MPH5_9PEZI